MADTEDKTPIKEEELDSRTRAQIRKELHETKAKQRKTSAEQLKADYLSAKDEPAILDILEKAKQFAAYHNKLAEDGVGAKNMGSDSSGAPIIEDYYLTDSQVARELGGSSALKQLVAYIENKLS